MAIKQLSIFVENKKGAIVTVTDALSHAGIDLRALSIADTQDFGIMRAIVDDLESAKAALDRESIIYKVNHVVAAAVPDSPGGLSELLGIISDGKVDIEYMYAFIAGSQSEAYVALRVGDYRKAEELLTSRGIRLIGIEDVKKK